jgi:hypothetical protein
LPCWHCGLCSRSREREAIADGCLASGPWLASFATAADPCVR